jgi:hypothetical protein
LQCSPTHDRRRNPRREGPRTTCIRLDEIATERPEVIKQTHTRDALAPIPDPSTPARSKPDMDALGQR